MLLIWPKFMNQIYIGISAPSCAESGKEASKKTAAFAKCGKKE